MSQNNDMENIGVGSIIIYTSKIIIPDGWLLCDGTELDSTNPEYSELYSIIGKKFGSNSENTFKIPDTRGIFIRGQDGGTGRDPNAITRTIAPWSGATGSSGLNIGSYQPCEIKSHTHTNPYPSGSPNIEYYGGVNVAAFGGRNPSLTTNSGGQESRPKNIYICHLIKYKTIRKNLFVNEIAMGENAGLNNQGQNGIAIGLNAGNINQGSGAIAIGANAGFSNQHNNTLIINASNSPLNSDGPNKTFISPISQTRTVPTNPSGTLMHDINTKEVFVDTAKTFVIEHPTDKDKYLVHACLEGPESGVFYRGVGEILTDSVEIELPDYVDKIASEFTVQITPVGKKRTMRMFTDEVHNNKFKVYGEPGKFYWCVNGKRCEIVVEQQKTKYNLNGNGPYKWISPK